MNKLKTPAFVTGPALKIWKEAVADLEKTGIACEIEANALGCYCRALADLATAQKEIDRDGPVVKTDRGFVKHPATTLKTAAMGQVYRFAVQFGLTPASRKRATTARRQNLTQK